MSSVPTLQLLSAIVDAANYGSWTIRRLSKKARDGISQIHYKEEGEARSAMTIADTAAQRIIVSSLLKSFPLLRIVGEEDDSLDGQLTDKDEDDNIGPINLNLNLNIDFQRKVQLDSTLAVPEELHLNDLTVFVDPLDGTREFVEGRRDNVQCLIGVCHKNIPIMGAIGFPFCKSTEKVEVIYGLVHQGVGKFLCEDESKLENWDLPLFQTYSAGDPIFVSSGDSKAGLLQDVIQVFQTVLPSMQRQIFGACGNKMIKVMTGESTLSVMHDKTCVWDTCAPTAILHAVGCKVTDFFGDPLQYCTQELGNKMGVVVSVAGANHLHDRVTLGMRGSESIKSRLKELG